MQRAEHGSIPIPLRVSTVALPADVSRALQLAPCLNGAVDLGDDEEPTTSRASSVTRARQVFASAAQAFQFPAHLHLCAELLRIMHAHGDTARPSLQTCWTIYGMLQEWLESIIPLLDSSFAAQNLSLAFPLQSRLYLRVMETIQIARDNSDSEQASQVHQLIHASVAFSYDFGFDIWPSTPIGPRARLDILNNRSRGMDMAAYQTFADARRASFSRPAMMPHLTALLDAIYASKYAKTYTTEELENARRKRKRLPRGDSLKLNNPTLHLLAFLMWDRVGLLVEIMLAERHRLNQQTGDAFTADEARIAHQALNKWLGVVSSPQQWLLDLLQQQKKERARALAQRRAATRAAESCSESSDHSDEDTVDYVWDPNAPPAIDLSTIPFVEILLAPTQHTEAERRAVLQELLQLIAGNLHRSQSENPSRSVADPDNATPSNTTVVQLQPSSVARNVSAVEALDFDDDIDLDTVLLPKPTQ